MLEVRKRTRPPKPSEDYEIGFGKPPKHSQFKKGQSGNYDGRPTNDLSLRNRLEAVLGDKVTVTINGKQKKLDRLEVATRKLVEKAMQGDTRAYAMLLKVLGNERSYQADQRTPAAIEVEAEALASMVDDYLNYIKGEDRDG